MSGLDKIVKTGVAFVWLAALLLAGPVRAGEKVGIVVDLSGPMMVRKIDGATRILAVNSAVELGDTLITPPQVDARLRLADDSDLILKKGTRLQITDFASDENDPNNNRATLVLSEGGLRYAPGLAGIRAKGHTMLRTPVGDIASESATFLVDYMPSPAQKGARADGPALSYARLVQKPRSSFLLQVQSIPGGPASALPPGLYVQVIDGLINVSNPAGAQSFAAGQFGYTASPTKLPVLTPKNPALQFTPPPTFSVGSAPSTANTGSKPSTQTPSKSNTVDCEVR